MSVFLLHLKGSMCSSHSGFTIVCHCKNAKPLLCLIPIMQAFSFCITSEGKYVNDVAWFVLEIFTFCLVVLFTFPFYQWLNVTLIHFRHSPERKWSFLLLFIIAVWTFAKLKPPPTHQITKTVISSLLHTTCLHSRTQILFATT